MTIYQRILVPIDGSETSRHGLHEAIRLAKAGGGRLRLLHVIDDLSFALAMDAYAGQQGDWRSTLREAGARLLNDAKAEAAAQDVQAEGALHESIGTRLEDAVAAEAARWQADLIVLGTHGRRGMGRLLLGSGAESVLRSAAVPVLVVRSPAPATQPQAAGEAAAASETEAPHTRVSVVTGALKIE